MVRFRGTIYVCHEPAKVWKLLSDWSRLSQWDENCESITPITPSSSSSWQSSRGNFSLGIGALWECKFDLNGRKVDAVYRCVEWEAGRRAVFCATSAFIRTRDTLEIIQAPGGCQVSLQFELYYRNILAPLSFTLESRMQQSCHRIMAQLKKFVELQLDELENNDECNANGKALVTSPHTHRDGGNLEEEEEDGAELVARSKKQRGHVTHLTVPPNSVMSHRPQVLSLYRKTFRIARTWANEGEREYIRCEARRLVRRNAHLTTSEDIARKIAEFDSRLEIGLHYNIASPRYPNVVPGATGLSPDSINPIYLDSIQGNKQHKPTGGIANRAPLHHD